MRLLPQPDEHEIDFVAVMHALADPVRLRLLVTLADDAEHSCTAAGEGIDVHKSTMTHHFRVLRDAGLISTRQEGRTRLVCLRRAELDARFPGVLDAALIAGRELAPTASLV